jgi:hypothetical protein
MSETTLLTEYECVEPVQHNQKKYLPGAPISLSGKDAAPLLAIKAIKVPEGKTEPTAPVLSELEQLLAVIPGVIEDKANLTSSGLPLVEALTEAVGFDVSADMRNEAWAAFQAKDAE